jgi:transcriptional regulator GlxA family with amidase domain
MLFKSVFAGLALGAQLSTAALAPDYKLAKRNGKRVISTMEQNREQSSNSVTGTAPTNWGVIVMPGASTLDVYGPLEMLYFVAANNYFNLTIITPNGENVVVKPPMGNPHNSTFSPEFVGSASFEDELDLDVLLVPGGAAARDPALTYVDDYLVRMRPQVDYLITICTGAIFAARGGLFDGRRATTNKNAWNLVTAHGENVTWVAPARYVIDGDTWSSSGVRPSNPHMTL